MSEWNKFPEIRPEGNGNYLVVFQGKSVDIVMYLNGHFRMYGENKDRLITHWMPLPEIPKEGGENG